jgi:hypothetical protein
MKHMWESRHIQTFNDFYPVIKIFTDNCTWTFNILKKTLILISKGNSIKYDRNTRGEVIFCRGVSSSFPTCGTWNIVIVLTHVGHTCFLGFFVGWTWRFIKCLPQTPNVWWWKNRISCRSGLDIIWNVDVTTFCWRGTVSENKNWRLVPTICKNWMVCTCKYMALATLYCPSTPIQTCDSA